MTGFELRLWRRGLDWTQERAAEELGVSLRTYKTYENTAPKQTAILAAQALAVRELMASNIDINTQYLQMKTIIGNERSVKDGY